MWRWDQQEPFGATPSNDNPSGAEAFEFNLRFRGQYFDKETGLRYNYFRDCYDPMIGRYWTSLSFSDTFGRCNYVIGGGWKDPGFTEFEWRRTREPASLPDCHKLEPHNSPDDKRDEEHARCCRRLLEKGDA